MDGRKIDRNDKKTPFVVRQFASSRIERQLLTQIFDVLFVSAAPSAVEHNGVGNILETHDSAKVPKSVHQSRNAGRRAA